MTNTEKEKKIKSQTKRVKRLGEWATYLSGRLTLAQSFALMTRIVDSNTKVMQIISQKPKKEMSDIDDGGIRVATDK